MDLVRSMSQSRGASRELLTLPKQSENGKYISMFHIDGAPILPPLMTSEKRRQMRKFKEEAIQLERKWAERRRDICRRVTIDTDQVLRSDVERYDANTVSEDCFSVRSCSTQFSSDVVAERDSYILLSSIMNSVLERKQTADSSTCTTSVDVVEGEIREQILEERIQKLRKSETLIYDNRSNTITINKPLTRSPQTPDSSQHPKQQNEQEPNVNPKVPVETQNSILPSPPQIPAICINPPTPTTESHRDWFSSASILLSGRNLPQPERNTATLFNEESNDEFGHIMAPRRNFEGHKKIIDITKKLNQSDDGKCGGHSISEAPYAPIRSATSPSLRTMQIKSQCIVIENNNNGTGDHPDSSLIRSNSFTLDAPSKALLDHIRQKNELPQGPDITERKPATTRRCCYPSASATRDTVESKAKRVQKGELKPRSQMSRIMSKSGQHCAYSPNSCKGIRSPYDLKISAKTKVARPTKSSTKSSPTSCLATSRSTKPKSLSLTPHSCGNITSRSAPKGIRPEILNEIEAEHRQKFMQLVAQQREEQKRLQETFETQQKLLLEELSRGLNKIQLNSPKSAPALPLHPRPLPPALEIHSHAITFPSSSVRCSPTEKSDKSDIPSNSSPTCSLINTINSYSLASSTLCDITSVTENSGSITNRSSKYSTPRRRLFAGDDSLQVSPVGTIAPSGGSTSVGRRSQLRQQHFLNQRRAEAATVLCAYARGFLTRRLFQTEQIQRIVQTIRDTLVFLLNLHKELEDNSEEANSAANIKLKARLLQQLSSATRTLHFFFFQTSVRDRMDILARDRKRIKAKLLNINTTRSPAIST